jgi:hypothetical protein
MKTRALAEGVLVNEWEGPTEKSGSARVGPVRERPVEV